MTKILQILIFSMLLAYLSHRNSGYDIIECRYQKKERLFYTIMAIGLILFAGLRTGYNDTEVYRHLYRTTVKEMSGNTDLLAGIDWSKTGENPGFFLILRVMVRMGFSVQTYLMVFSAFTIGVHLWFFRKYSCNMWLSVLLFIVFAGYTFNLAAVKQCTAMALCLIATDGAIRKKYIRFVIYVLVAHTIHPYALMYLIVPFLFFRPWSKYTVIMLIVFGVVGASMQSLVGTVLNVTDMLGESYNAASFTGEGVNPLRLAVTAVPIFLSMLVSEQIAETEERDHHLIVNLSMLNGEIMFMGLFGTANYFARLANYFLPFQAVAIPWLLKHYDYESRRTLTIIASICYILFFVYNNGIQESFDAHYWSISLWDYLQSVFERVLFG